MNKSWLNETPNHKHAIFTAGSAKKYYPHLTTLNFRCPYGMEFLGAMGLVVMQSTCQQNGGWSKEWPMCKGLYKSIFSLMH